MSGPSLRLQTASLYVSSYTAAFSGSGGPFGYSPETGEFGGVISSAGLASEPFSDSLTGVMAGDIVTFVTTVENIGGAPAYALLLRGTLPTGFSASDVMETSLTDGAGTPIGTTGQLFDPAGGLTTTASTPVAAYDANSGRNILLLTYTLQVPTQVALTGAVLPIVMTAVQYRTSVSGATIVSGVAAGTTIATEYPSITVTPPAPIALGATGVFTVTITLPEGQVRDLRLDDLLPPNLSFVSGSVTRTGHQLSGVLPIQTGASFRLGDVLDTSDGVADAQDQIVLSVVARAVQSTAGQFSATVSAADPAGGPRWSTVASAPASIAAPALGLTVTAPTVAQAGQSVTVTMRLTNTGSATANSVLLSDHLGAGLTLVPGSIVASGTAATAAMQPRGAQLGALAAGETLLVTLQATVDPGVAAGATLDVGADAVALAGGASAVTATAPATITAVAPRIILGRLPLGFAVGDVLTLSALVQLPPGPSPDVRATIALPAGLAYVAGSAGAGASVAGQAVTVALGASDGLQSYTVSLQARVLGSAAVGISTVGAKVSTGYTATAADAIPVTVFNSAPVLTTATTTLALADTGAAMPFADTVLSDANTNQTETVSIQSNPVAGQLSGPGVYDPTTGTFTLAGSVAMVNTGLAAIKFSPVRRLVPVGETVGTDLLLSVSDGAGGTAASTVHLDVITADATPTVGGVWAGQRTTTSLPVLAFTQLSLTDPDTGQGGTLTIRNLSPGTGTLGGVGTLNGFFQQTGTLAQLQTAARGLVFTPSSVGQAQLSVTLDDHAGGVAQDNSTTIAIAPSGDPGGQVQHFGRSDSANYLVNYHGAQALLRGETYQGPVPYLQSQFIYDGPSAVLEAQAPNSFVKTFAGDSAIRVTAGRNIIDAGKGSNFIEGGPGADTFYLNAIAGQVAWDTIVNFHVGDAVTLFGFNPSVSTYQWTDDDGAVGYTGRTIHAVLSGSGPVTASLTFAGKSAADTAHFAVTTGSLGTLNYLAVYSL